jgi:hypothetical protein
MSVKNLEEWAEVSLKEEVVSVFSLKDAADFYFKKVSNEVWIATNRQVTPESEELKKVEDHDWKPNIQREVEPEDKTVKTTVLESIQAQKRPSKKNLQVPADLKWSRWALKKSDFKLRINPCFPNLPVVVRPEYEFRLTRGAEATFYVRIPVWAQIQDISDGDLLITEIPSMILSRTWFGEFTEGEICYWFKSTARRKITDDIFKPHLCVCPINVLNNSDEELNIDKLCLRCESLSVFKDGNNLWADKMIIEYKGGNQFSDLIVTGKAPDEAPNAVLIGKPRSPIKKGFAQRTFKILNEIQSKFG